MALYQSSVLNKYLATQDADQVAKAYNKYTNYFLNKEIQENIRNSKEEQFQEGFLRELFVNILGYTINPDPNYNLTTELKNIKDAKKTDGAILVTRGHVPLPLAVIELKGTDTKDLSKVNDQAFNYKNNQPNCVYVITSNFEKLRFFIHNAVEHEEFNLFTLTKERFDLLWLFLQKDNLLGGIPAKIKEESLLQEEKITKVLYADYSAFKNDLWNDMVQQNPQHEPLLLYKKSQKLLDRFLFIFFAEDKGLLPPNSINVIVEQWIKLKELDEYKPLYDRFKKYFGYMNDGYKGAKYEIHAYNGGLFKADELLDSLLIDDQILKKHCLKLTKYNFADEVDTNILGHIFEHSLNDIENVRAQLAGEEVDKSKTKRKKDGVFYTPKYITKYIVDNTVGKLCEEKKAEIGIDDEEYAKERKGRRKDTIKKLDAQLKQYRKWLLQLTICDPACGSGAFLNQALEFLMAEHRYVDELQTQLFEGSIVFQDVENHILENNIYGVDINEESVEIARLSLWLRTAKKGRKLTSLSSNIKCGNSLIDDPEVAGDLAFNWQKEFPGVFREKEKQAFHITTATHDSRTSQRMIDHKVRLKRDNGLRPKAQPIWLETEDELFISQTVAEVVTHDKLNVLAYNICGDHMHLILVCEASEVPRIVGKIKAITAKEYNRWKGYTTTPTTTTTGHSTRGHVPLSEQESEKEKSVPLWTQKFGCKEITDSEQLYNTISYIENNRLKHDLPPNPETDNNKGTCPLVKRSLVEVIETFTTDIDHAYRTEYTGGFDVVIGNPPYVNIVNIENALLRKHYQTEFKTFKNKCDLYSLFIERSVGLARKDGELGFIFPNSWLGTSSFSKFREMLSTKVAPHHLVELPPGVFADAIVTTVIMAFRNSESTKGHQVGLYRLNQQMFLKHSYALELDAVKKTESFAYSFAPSVPMRNHLKKLGEIAEFSLGIKTSDDKRFVFEYKKDENAKPLLRGKDIGRYHKEYQDMYLWYMPDLIKEKAGGRPRVLEHYLKPKIVIQDIAKSISATYDDEQYLVNDTINIIHEVKAPFQLHSILAILNSKLCSAWFNSSFPEGLHIKINQLQEIPIPELTDNHLSFLSERAKLILEASDKHKSSSNQLIQLLQSNFDIEKPSTKLQHWPSMDFKGFLAEIEKGRKAAGHATREHAARGHVPVLPLSLAEQAEWMEYFHKKKAEAIALQSEIDRIDKEIDQMVYQLYGLTAEEIAIVENN